MSHAPMDLHEQVSSAILERNEARALALFAQDPAGCATAVLEGGGTLLHWASPMPTLFRALLDAGADPCAAARQIVGPPIYPLDEAGGSIGTTADKRLQSIEMLLQAGVIERMGAERVYQVFDKQLSAPMRHGLVKLLLQYGFPATFVRASDGAGLAMQVYDNTELLLVLRQAGAPLVQTNGESALTKQINFRINSASIDALLQIAPELLTTPSTPWQNREPSGRVHYPLDLAIKAGVLSTTEILLQHGARKFSVEPTTMEAWRLVLRYGAAPFEHAPAFSEATAGAVFAGYAEWSPRLLPVEMRPLQNQLLAEFLERLRQAGPEPVATAARSISHISALKEAFGLKSDGVVALLPLMETGLATTVMDVMISAV